METQKNVTLGSIEKELAQLRNTQANMSKTKACLFNLILYTKESKRAQYFQEMVHKIISQFPCRILFIQENADASAPLLRLHASVESGGEGMACDQVTIEASPDQLSLVPFLCLPLFVPDLPIYLLWGQDPTTDEAILPHLRQFATRIIFESECAQDLQSFSQRMLKYFKTCQMEVTDLNWARVGGWRDVLAQTFDSASRIEQLRSARLIKISYNQFSDDLFLQPDTQAFYLQAWLAAQLKWQFDKREQIENLCILHYRHHQMPIRVLLQPLTRKDLLPEEIIEIEVSDQKDYLFSLTRQGENQVLVHISTPEQCEMPFTIFLPNIRSGRGFIQEILYQKTSQQYFSMLQLISHIQESQS